MGAILGWQRVSDCGGLDLQNSSMNEQSQTYAESVSTDTQEPHSAPNVAGTMCLVARSILVALSSVPLIIETSMS
jgi:hypothetical protein